MANTSVLILATAIACLFVVSHVAGQTSAPTGELRYNGDNGDNKKLTDDTNIIEDNTRPVSDNSNNNNNNQRRPFGGLFNSQDSSQYDTPNFGQSLLPPFGNLFGPMQENNGGFMSGPQQRPFSFLDNLFGSIRQQTQNLHRNFERQFSDLERKAGEGQDVSYFNRNGVAYVRTCTTKRVSPSLPSEQKESKVLPMDAANSEKISEERPVIPSSNLDGFSSQETSDSRDATSPEAKPATGPVAPVLDEANNSPQSN